MIEVIVLIIIVFFLAGILFIALRKIINGVTAESKEYYFKKIQDIDEKLMKMQNDSDVVDGELIKIKEEYKREDFKSVDKALLKLLNSTNYANKNVLRELKNVDRIFQIDEESIIKNFLVQADANFDNSNVNYQLFLDRFSPNLIYKLKNYRIKDQEKEIKKLLTIEEINIFNEYLKFHKYSLKGLILYLKESIAANPTCIEVFVGDENKNYDYLSPYIKTTYRDDIFKGIMIKYQNRIYDYSINERDVV